MLTSRSLLRALALACVLVLFPLRPSAQSARPDRHRRKPAQLPAATYRPEFGTNVDLRRAAAGVLAPHLRNLRQTRSGWITCGSRRSVCPTVRRLSYRRVDW